MMHPLLDRTNQKVNYQLDQEDGGINLGELITTILNGKYLIIILALIFLIAGTVKTLLDTPIYKADAMLQIEEKSNSLDALESVAPLMESKLPVLAEIEIIKSRKILGEAVKNLNLDIIAKPKYLPEIGEAIARRFQNHNVNRQVSAPLFGLEQYAWGGEEIHVDSFSIQENWIGKQLTLLAGDHGHFTLLDNNKPLLEGDVGKPAIKKPDDDNQPTLTLFLSLLKARPGTEFIVIKQPLSSAISQLNTSLTVVEKVKNTGILSFTLEASSPILATRTLNEVTGIYLKQNVEQKSKEAQSTLEFLDKQLPALKDQLEAATNALNEFRTKKGSIDLDTETQHVLNGVVEIESQLTLLQQKRDELRQKFTESHPSVIAIDKQIARLQSQMSANDKKIEALPETQQVILRLSRDVKVSTELYMTLLNNAQTLRVAKAGAVGNVRIIDEAVLPTQSIKPNKPLIIGISLLLGIVSGLALVFIRKALHNGVEDPEQIEKHLNIPVYATIPHSDGQAKLSEKLKKLGAKQTNGPVILALENRDDLAIESLRSLRTTLHFAFLEAQNNIILISGPCPGIGKTFVATNLAIVLADAGKKILLIDGDLRRGLVNNSLGLSRGDGLSELISNDISLEHAIRHIASANIDFISTGSIPPNPSELLLHERFGQLLETLSKKYDHIIIDTPPILAVTDTCIIGRMASATLMVVRAGQHPMRELEQSTKRLIQAGVHLKGIVFNDLPETSTKYGYGKYVYRYNYQKSV